MKEKKELAYSRALVPIKKMKYKIIISVLLIVIIIVAIISLVACSAKENIKL